MRANWDKFNSGVIIPESVMHRISETHSIQYDYSGKENYEASYFMADINIGSKINVVSSARFEGKSTEYQSYKSVKSPAPHWVYTGEPSSQKRKNSFFLPALFVHLKPTDWLHIRFAGTNTLTRPDYRDLTPFYEIDGTYNTIDYRNPLLVPGLSKNIDFLP